MSLRYKVKIWDLNPEIKTLRPTLEWAREHCGKPGIDWAYYNSTFRFRFKKTYTFFLLRWS